LGNVRLSYSDADGNGVVTGDIVVNECSGGYCNNYIITGEIEGVTNYYPFGLMHNSQFHSFNNAYQQKYNGKEIQETGLYDYGWRQYMPDIGRWNGIDQLAESYMPTSTYAYVANNPVLRFDVDGRWFNEDGTIDTSGHTPGFVSGHQYLNSFLGANNSNSGGGGSTEGGMSPDLFNKMFSLGGTWTNTGYGFESADHISLGYNGSYQSLNTLLDKYINIPEIVLTGSSSGWGSQAQGAFNSFMKDWYTWGGRGNWAFGTGATISGFVGIAQSENMYAQGIRRGLAGNYQLTGRNLSQFGSMSMTNATKPISGLAKWGGRLSRVSFGAGLVMDGIGVLNYRNNPNSPNAVHPTKAGLNTVMGYVGLKGGAYGAIISTLYFGIDAFYPGGWVGASETAARTEAHEQQMTGHPFFSNSAIKF